MKTLILLFSIILTVPVFAQQEITVQNGEIQLNGTLLKPKKAKNLVIIIAGSGPTDRDGNSNMLKGDNNSLKYLAEGLESKGIASYRYDKRSLLAANRVDEINVRFDDFVSDAEAIYSYFKTQGIYDRIGFAGHSEGSLIGAIAALRLHADFMISISGAGMSMPAIIKTQISKQFKPQIAEIGYAITDSIVAGKTVANVPKELLIIYRPEIQPYIISWFKYDPVQVYGSLSCPILVLQGDNDLQVQVADAEILANCNPRAQKHIFKGMNHVLKISPTDRFQNVSTYDDPKLPVPKELTATISRFLDGL